jgi:hypothetical protein
MLVLMLQSGKEQQSKFEVINDSNASAILGGCANLTSCGEYSGTYMDCLKLQSCGSFMEE